MSWTTLFAVFVLPLVAPVASAVCQHRVASSVAAPVVRAGWVSRAIVTGLNDPRGIIFDKAGHLLVVERNTGVKALTMGDTGGACVWASAKKTVISDGSLNHGIQLSASGTTLFVSSANSVWSYTYNPATASVDASSKKLLVTGMDNSDHTTRTLLLSKKRPGYLLVSRGSGDNFDDDAKVKETGHAQLRGFDITASQNIPYDYTDGDVIGWGLRNEVGVAEAPNGGIWGVENSADEVSRYGTNFHNDNPGEELNYFGTLVNNQSPNQGGNFGYPDCLAAYKADEVPQGDGVTVGSQFSIEPDNISDQQCRDNRVAPRMVFQAHMAPLDIKFNKNGTTAWVTFHGSWDRRPPVGYKVAKIAFQNGQPVRPSTSLEAADTMVRNAVPANCGAGCFRPVGLAWDKKDRLYFSSDATGEIYIITRK